MSYEVRPLDADTVLHPDTLLVAGGVLVDRYRQTVGNDERAKLAFYIGGLGTGGMHAGALAGIVHEPVAAWTAGGMALGCAWAVRAWRKTAPHPHP